MLAQKHFEFLPFRGSLSFFTKFGEDSRLLAEQTKTNFIRRKGTLIMKLILAIVSNDDSGAVSSALTREGFSVTKLATTGGFLMAGNTTFISGVEDSKVDEVIGIISKYSSRRTQIVPHSSTMEVGMYSSFPVEVTVGGSTIFVLNVDRFEKV